MTTNAGINDLLEERFPDKSSLRSGEIDGTKYKIYLIGNTSSTEINNASHMCSYIHLQELFLKDPIRLDKLPSAPTQSGFNFGPSKDGWIGCSTARTSDYNYYKDGTPFPLDSRMDEENLLGCSVTKYTPDYLESKTIEWIEDLPRKLVSETI